MSMLMGNVSNHAMIESNLSVSLAFVLVFLSLGFVVHCSGLSGKCAAISGVVISVASVCESSSVSSSSSSSRPSSLSSGSGTIQGAGVSSPSSSSTEELSQSDSSTGTIKVVNVDAIGVELESKCGEQQGGRKRSGEFAPLLSLLRPGLVRVEALLVLVRGAARWMKHLWLVKHLWPAKHMRKPEPSAVGVDL